MKVKIIYNPEARAGKSKKLVPLVEEQFKEAGIDFLLTQTEAPLHAMELAESAKNEGYNHVVALGGDGTVHEVGNGAIRGGLVFGVIPIGSGNDFAGGIGIKEDWQQGVNTIIQGKKQKISVVRANDRYSLNVLDIGFGADVAKAAYTRLKWISGSFKYTLLTLGLLTKHKPYPVTLDIDGEIIDYQLNLLAAGFGQTFGSGMNILPDARFNKDKMQISIIHSTGRFKFLRIFPKVFSAKHVKYTENVKMLFAKKIKLTPKIDDDRVLLGEAEGEVFSEGSITFEAIPNALEVMTLSTWSLDNLSSKID